MPKLKIRAWLGRAWRFFASAGDRETIALPAARLSNVVRQPLPKPTPANLRRFSETPVARKAINTIKDRIACMRWRVEPKDGSPRAPESDARIRILRANFGAPNPDDSFRSLTERIIEDLFVAGCGSHRSAGHAGPPATGDALAGGQHNGPYLCGVVGRNGRAVYPRQHLHYHDL